MINHKTRFSQSFACISKGVDAGIGLIMCYFCFKKAWAPCITTGIIYSFDMEKECDYYLLLYMHLIRTMIYYNAR